MGGTAWTFGVSEEGGVEFSIGGADTTPVRAGEPSGFPSRTMLIVGGLAVAAIALIFLLKP